MNNPLLIKLASFIWPVTTKTYASAYSGTVEITWFKGKKMVDTQNANYSYGNLEKILCFGLQKVSFTQVNHILVLGLGAGSVIKTLQKDFNFTHAITAIELDPVMIQIAQEEYGITPTDKLTIVNTDAFEFVKTTTTSYDLIIIDLFIDTEVPDGVYTSNFFNNIYRILNPNGQFVFNAALLHNNLPDVLTKTLSGFSIKTYEKVLNTNTVIIGYKI